MLYRFFLINCLFLLTPVAYAGSSGNTTIERLIVAHNFSPARAYVDVLGAVTGQASCHTPPDWDFMLDISTAEGRAVYATLLAAMLQKKTIRVIGDGVCTIASNYEDVRYVYIYD